jgi:hypothetical protein
VEERHGFNLMISILSQSKDGECKMLLYKSVYHLAEIFVIMMMDITQLPDADQLMRIIEVFPHFEVSWMTTCMVWAKLLAKRRTRFKKNFLVNMDKLHGGHVTSMIMQMLYSRENIDIHARAIMNIFPVIDPKMQSLIQVPWTSNTINQLHLSSSQASLALACLIQQFYCQGDTAIRKQELAMKAYYALCKQEIVISLNFRKSVRTVLAVYDTVWRYYLTYSENQ